MNVAFPTPAGHEGRTDTSSRGGPLTQHRILYVAANPLGTGQLALDKEARAIQLELERGARSEHFKLETRWAAQPEDLLPALRKLRPTVVHFSGHGGHDEPGAGSPGDAADRDITATSGAIGASGGRSTDRQYGLLFGNEDGRSQLVPTEAIAEAFRAARSSVKLVVLNACYSDVHAEALLAHVDCVVGVDGAIRDDAARRFSVGFYGGIADRQSVKAAYEQGRAGIRLDGLPDGKKPQFRIRDGLDADHLVLADISAPPVNERALPYDIVDADRVNDFVGREQELAAMAARLLPGAPRKAAGAGPTAADRAKRTGPERPVFVITGSSGIGKSLLAQKFADQSRSSEPERPGQREPGFEAAVHIPYDKSAEVMAGSIAERFRDRTEVQAIQRPLDRLGELCGDHRTLLTIDDALEAGPVQALLSKLPPGFAVIVTTRNRTLRELAEHHTADLTPFSLEQSLALLARLRSDDAIKTSVDARRICEVVGHLPGALKLVDGYCRRSKRATLASFVEEFCADQDRQQLFEDGLQLSKRGLRPDDNDRRPLTMVIDMVLEQLGSEAQQFYRCLSACDPAGFSVETAAAAAFDGFASARDRAVRKARRLLDELHAQALVELGPGPDERYALHALFATHAAVRAAEHGDDAPARGRHARLWMDRLRDSDLLAGLGLPDILHANRGDLARAAIHSAVTGALDDRLVEQLNEFFDRAQLPEQARQTMDAVVRWADGSGDLAAAALARVRSAKVCGRVDPAAARAVLDEVEGVLARLPDGPVKRSIEVKRLVRLGALQKRGGLAAALDTLHRAVELARLAEDPVGLQRALNTLALAYHQAGKFELALPAAREAFALEGDTASVAARYFGHRLLADCLLYAGHVQEAREVYRKCWESASTGLEVIFLANHLMDVAQDQRDRRHIAAAREIIQLQGEVSAELPSSSLFVRGRIVLGDICVKDGKVPEALAAYDEVARRVAERVAELRDTRPVTGALRSLAAQLRDQRRYKEEQKALGIAVDVATAGRDHEVVARLVNRIGLILARDGRTADAREKFEHQLQLGRDHALPLQEVYAHEGLAALHRTAGEREREIEQLGLALVALGGVRGQARTRGRIEILGRQMIACMHAGQIELGLRAMVDYERALLHCKKVDEHASAPPHNAITMALKRLGAPGLLALLRTTFAQPDRELATILTPRVLRVADEVCADDRPAEDWIAALVLLFELLIASSPHPRERMSLGLLRRAADEATRRDGFDLVACIDRSSEGSAAAREALRGFLTLEPILDRTAGPARAGVHELRRAEPGALNFPLIAMRSYLCKRLADRFRALECWPQAERLYRAAIDACEATNDDEHQAKARVSLQAVLLRMEGRELDLLAHLEHFADGPAPRDTRPVTGGLRGIGSRFRDQGRHADERRALELAVVVAKAGDDFETMASVLNRLGFNHARDGRAAEARANFEAQIQLGRDHALPLQEAYGREGLAALHREAGEREQEIEHHARALEAVDRVTGQGATKGRLEILGRQMIACMHAGQYALGVRSIVDYERALLHCKKLDEHASAPPHNAITMALKRLGAPGLLALLRTTFEPPDRELAAVLIPRVLRVADEVCAVDRPAPAEDWLAALVFLLDLLIAAGPHPRERTCLGLLRRAADEAARRDDFDLLACIDRSSEGSVAAREALRGFLTLEPILDRTTGPARAGIRELARAEPTALGFPLLVMRSYLCKRLADRFRALECWPEAERLYRAAIDACEATDSDENLARALLSLQAVLLRMTGRELDALGYLERLVAGPARLLADAEPAKQALVAVGQRLLDAGDADAALRAALTLVELARQRGSREIEARAAHLEGWARQAMGDVALALDAFRRQISLGVELDSQRHVDYGLSAAEATLRTEPGAAQRPAFWLQLADDLETVASEPARGLRVHALRRLAHAWFQRECAEPACDAFVAAVAVQSTGATCSDAQLHEFLDEIHSLDLAHKAAGALVALSSADDAGRAAVARTLLEGLRAEIARHPRPRRRGGSRR